MFAHICAVAALTLIASVAHADEAQLLTGRLYAADALPERMVGPIEEVHLVELPSGASRAAREDLYGRLPVFRIAPGEALDRPELRGTIARAALYMSDRYGFPLTSADRLRYHKWSSQHPAAEWEFQRNRINACAQHDTGNHFIGVADPCGLPSRSLAPLDRLARWLRD